MFTVIFSQAARAELIEAQDWYEGGAAGLSKRFIQAIDVLVERMTDNLLQFPVVFKDVRRALLRRFPYSLFFVVDDEVLLVISCFPFQSRSFAMAKEDLRSGLPSLGVARLTGS